MVSPASDGIYIRSILEFALWTGPLHFHPFAKCAPACDEKRRWKSETLRWTFAVGSEQERLQWYKYQQTAT